MRLWHEDLIPYLPKGQLVSQWRELNSIYKKEDKHILINYIYSYTKEELLIYSLLILKEFKLRGYKVNKWSNFNTYFQLDNFILDINNLDLFIHKNSVNFRSNFYKEHNDEYLKICFFNLKEKYLRGQKDFGEKEFIKLVNFMINRKIQI